jgi:hypothetical protein
LRVGREGTQPDVRKMYIIYWLLIVGGIVLYLAVGLAAE